MNEKTEVGLLLEKMVGGSTPSDFRCVLCQSNLLTHECRRQILERAIKWLKENGYEDYTEWEKHSKKLVDERESDEI